VDPPATFEDPPWCSPAFFGSLGSGCGSGWGAAAGSKSTGLTRRIRPSLEVGKARVCRDKLHIAEARSRDWAEICMFKDDGMSTYEVSHE